MHLRHTTWHNHPKANHSSIMHLNTKLQRQNQTNMSKHLNIIDMAFNQTHPCYLDISCLYSNQCMSMWVHDLPHYITTPMHQCMFIFIKEIKQTKQNHTKKETQRQKKQLKQRLKHVSKTKGKQVERIRLFWARIWVCIHRACIRSSVVCVCISQVCMRMHEVCVRIHPEHQNLENAE